MRERKRDRNVFIPNKREREREREREYVYIFKLKKRQREGENIFKRMKNSVSCHCRLSEFVVVKTILKGAGKTMYIVSARFRFLLPTYPDLT